MHRWKVRLGPGSSQPAAQLVALLAVLILAYALRISCIDCQSLWLDEAASAYWTATPLGEMLRDTADNLHVPGYYLLLKAWVQFAGRSAFSLRYFSLLGGLFFVPLSYWFARRFLNHDAFSILAALVAALNPAHIYYAQEARMYAMLPPVYLLILALTLAIAVRATRKHWVALIVLEFVAIFFHLFSALMVVVVNLCLVVVYWKRQRTRQFFNSWLVSQLILVLFSLPWLLYLWISGGALPANLSDTTGGATITLHAYLLQVWAFLLTGLTSLRPFLRYWTEMFGFVFAAALVVSVAVAKSRVRGPLLVLLAALFVPLVAGALAWRFNPLTHPRYLFFLTAPAIILIAHVLVWLIRQRHFFPFTAALFILLLVLDTAALRSAWLDNANHRYDSATLAGAIATHGGPEDIALMPPFDRSLWYYDPAPVPVANWPFASGDQARRAEQLETLLRGSESAFLVTYHDLYSYDLHGQVPFILEGNGHLLETFVVDRMDVRHYALDSWRAPRLSPMRLDCGPVRLSGAYFPPKTFPGDAPAVALQWRLLEETGQTLVASARLMDGDQQLAAADRKLLNESERSTETWIPGAEALTYFVLPFPLGTPPLKYDLEVVLYAEGGDPLPCGSEREALHVGEVSLQSADQRAVDVYGTWEDTNWQEPVNSIAFPGLQLEAFSVSPASLGPAQPIHVTLRWRAADGDLPRLAPVLLMQDSGATVYAQEGDLFQRYPTSEWQEGDLFIETRQLIMPPTLNPVQLSVAIGDDVIDLADLRIDSGSLRWNVPEEATPTCVRFAGVGSLDGYIWQPADDGAHAGLDLFWQGSDEAPATESYTVFAQLLAPDLNVIAQQDSLPARGARPTTTWLPGEIILDEHTIDLPATLQPDTRLAIGLYLLETLERVPAYDCQGHRLENDSFSVRLSVLE